MAIALPASLQELVGRRILRISTSFARDRLIFDTNAVSTNQRTRYAYAVTQQVDRIYNLSEMVGYAVLAIETAVPEANGQEKLVIRTSGQEGFGVIYFSSIQDEEGRITEDGQQRVLEQTDPEECVCRLTEISGLIEEVVLQDITTEKAPPYELDAGSRNYVVEEGDVNYGVGPARINCHGECTPYIPPAPLAVSLTTEPENGATSGDPWFVVNVILITAVTGGTPAYSYSFSLEAESHPGDLVITESSPGDYRVWFNTDPGSSVARTATVRVIVTDANMNTAEDTAPVSLRVTGV